MANPSEIDRARIIIRSCLLNYRLKLYFYYSLKTTVLPLLNCVQNCIVFWKWVYSDSYTWIKIRPHRSKVTFEIAGRYLKLSILNFPLAVTSVSFILSLYYSLSPICSLSISTIKLPFTQHHSGFYTVSLIQLLLSTSKAKLSSWDYKTTHLCPFMASFSHPSSSHIYKLLTLSSMLGRTCVHMCMYLCKSKHIHRW